MGCRTGGLWHGGPPVTHLRFFWTYITCMESRMGVRGMWGWGWEGVGGWVGIGDGVEDGGRVGAGDGRVLGMGTGTVVRLEMRLGMGTGLALRMGEH